MTAPVGAYIAQSDGHWWTGRRRDVSTFTGPLAQLTRSGSILRAGGKVVKLAGFNFPDAVISDSVGTGTLLTPMSTVLEILDQGVAMGMNAVRIHTAGINYGKPGTAMVTNGAYSEPILQQIDRVYDACRTRKLWIMRPFTDRWNYWHGGAISFAEMMGVTGTDDQKRTAFFTDTATIRPAFFAYVSTLANRVNTINGQKYLTDTTDAIWETGNEIWDVPAAWSAAFTAFLKGLAPKLTADGSAASGLVANTKFHTSSGGDTDANMDIVGAHNYDDQRNNIPAHQQQVAWANAANKVHITGEYDARNNSQGTTNSTAVQNPGTTRAQWLAELEQFGGGDFMWSFIGTANASHDDGYQLNAASPANAEQVAMKADLAVHARVLTAAPTGFVQRSGTALTLGGAPYRPFFASTNGQSTPASSVVSLAQSLSLNSVRLTDFLDVNGTIGTAEKDPTRWAKVDAIIAAMAAAGMKVILDLACYRNMLKKQLGPVAPYTYDWSSFLSFVLTRVNTVSGVTYKNDPAISYVSFAGEVTAPNFDGGVNETTAQLTSFYSTVSSYWKSNGGQQLLSAGGWLYWQYTLSQSGIDSAAIAALSGIDIMAIHDYNDNDVSQGLPHIAQVAAAANKPWIAEESGQDITATGQSDTTRRDYFNARYAAHDAQAPRAAGEGFWNLAMPGSTPGGYDVVPGTLTAAAVIARAAATQ